MCLIACRHSCHELELLSLLALLLLLLLGPAAAAAATAGACCCCCCWGLLLLLLLLGPLVQVLLQGWQPWHLPRIMGTGHPPTPPTPASSCLLSRLQPDTTCCVRSLFVAGSPSRLAAPASTTNHGHWPPTHRYSQIRRHQQAVRPGGRGTAYG
jgi:hypothetical protein